VFAVVLYQPEIPPNTGNVIRLCANTGAELHLVEPLGFDFTTRPCAAPGWIITNTPASFATPTGRPANRACRAPDVRDDDQRGSEPLHNGDVGKNDVFVFGCETSGLPAEVMAEFKPEHRCVCPCSGQRSLNLSNAAAVTVFEAWRQIGFTGSL
jgi:tRNA (cytidine/uridine-2'-O-)-methyltransferase